MEVVGHENAYCVGVTVATIQHARSGGWTNVECYPLNVPVYYFPNGDPVELQNEMTPEFNIYQVEYFRGRGEEAME